ncbi:hypothetical protein [Rothia nasimurium]|uniref:hypothetical protein n=1 Tax=Rothia nasimurium TaxID=85336 RepID=UPI001F358D4D|nr:hypothetical protein [Rothia nasimurium]
MNEESASNIELEDVALELLHALRNVISPEDYSRLYVDELDAQQAPGLTLEILEGLAKKYRPHIQEKYKSVIQEEFGYTF